MCRFTSNRIPQNVTALMADVKARDGSRRYSAVALAVHLCASDMYPRGRRWSFLDGASTFAARRGPLQQELLFPSDGFRERALSAVVAR